MNKIKKAILDCKTPKELNSLRTLFAKDMKEHPENFKENQKAFIKMKNKFKRVPQKKRGPDFEKIYNSKVKQRTALEESDK